MRYLNKTVLLFVLCSLLISTKVFCQTNPFNAVFSVKTDDVGGDVKNILIIGVVSERSEGKYKLIVDINGGFIKAANNSEVFSGKADSAVRREHYIPLEVLKEGSGELLAKIYTFTDSMDVETSSQRAFVAKYSVKKKAIGDGYDITISDTKEQQVASETESDSGKTANTGQLTITDMKEVIGSSPDTQDQLQDNAQKFVINTQKRYNNFGRSLLFVFSFFILGYLCYRILVKK